MNQSGQGSLSDSPPLAATVTDKTLLEPLEAFFIGVVVGFDLKSKNAHRGL